MNSKKPILVTGSHRSGTTWVGRVIDASPLVGYIHEPFNLHHSIGICGARFHQWFTYISSENQSTYHKHVKKTISFSYNTIPQIKMIRQLEDMRRLIRENNTFRKYRRSHVRPLIKDPIAVFSAEWLAQTFDMDVIVMIRHPAAFASSLKRLDWTHPFPHFLEQPLLMRDHLYPFEAEIREYASKEHDIVDQAALLWRLIYHTVAKYQENHDDWVFVRHEDLSRDPLTGFENIFKRLNLEYSKHVNEAIRKHTDSTNTSEAPFSIMRDSKSHIWAWKSRLTESEIERIRAKVEDISRIFYSDQDW